MFDSRAMYNKHQMDLETIEEEDADFLSQNSRANLKNGRRAVPSQTNTITTYDTQQTDFLDLNSLGYLNLNNPGSARNSLYRTGPGGTISGIGGTRANSLKSVDKWDRNYYYNDYGPRDPLGLYQSNNPSRRGTNKLGKSSSRMANCFSWIWCGSSIRYFVLLLSFLALASLFANLQLFNIVALYAEKDLLPSYLQHESANANHNDHYPGAIHWASSKEGEFLQIKKEEDLPVTKERIGELSGNDPFEGKEENEEEAGGVKKNLTELGGPSQMENKEQLDIRNNMSENAGIEKRSPLAQPLNMRNSDGNPFNWFLQSLCFSIPGLTILLGHFPSVLLIRHFGAHKVIFGALLLSGAVTATFPFIIGYGDLSSFYIVLTRSLLGLSFSPSFTFIGTNANRWATVGEQLFFVLLGFTALQFGPILSWISAVSLLNMDHLSRIRLFGLHSAVSTLLAIFWLLFYRDLPQKFNLVNGEELHKIMKGKPTRHRRPRLPQSLRCILLRSTSAWACWTASFCYFFAQLSLLTFLPIFVFRVLRHTLQIYIVTPFILMLLSHLFVHVIHRLFGPDSTWKVRIFNSIAFLFSALLFLGLTIIPRDHNYGFRCALLLWLCLLPLGLCSAGFIKSAVVCGRFFAQHIVAHMQIAFGFAYFLVPTLVFLVESESSIVHWRLLFLATALVLLLGLAIFIILGRGTPTRWAYNWAEEAKGEDSLLMVKFTRTPFE